MKKKQRTDRTDVNDEILTVSGIASMLGIGEESVRRKLRDGSIYGVKRFGKWYVLKSELIRYFINGG